MSTWTLSGSRWTTGSWEACLRGRDPDPGCRRGGLDSQRAAAAPLPEGTGLTEQRAKEPDLRDSGQPRDPVTVGGRSTRQLRLTRQEILGGHPRPPHKLCYCETVKNITVSVPDDVYRNAR